MIEEEGISSLLDSHLMGLEEEECLEEEEYLKEADAIEDAVRKVLAEGYRTVDIMDEDKKQVGTTEMGNLICDRI